MKKYIAIWMTVVLLLSCLSACGKPETNADDASGNKGKLVEINYFSCVEILGTADEVDGSGTFTYSTDISRISYDKTNEDLTAFLKSIKTSIDCENGKLHNGDVVTITLSYSHSEAEALGVTMKETSKSYTAVGLIEVLRAPTVDCYEQMSAELRATVERAYPEENEPTIVMPYWFYAYDNCGEPYIAAMAALFSYQSGGYTEYDIRMVHIRGSSYNLMDRILATHEFHLEYENQSGITFEQANELAKAAFAIEGVCFAEEISE